MIVNNRMPEDEIENALCAMRKRDADYDRAYLKAGEILQAFFPNGIALKSSEDFLRYQIFSFCVAKMNRYSQNMKNGGHKDSSVDLINYAAILSSITPDLDEG